MRRRNLIGALLFVMVFFNIPIASANTGTITITCTGATYAYTGFPNKPNNTVRETVKIDGVTVATRTFSFNGPSGTDTVPFTLDDTKTQLVQVRSAWSTNGVTGSIGKSARLGPDCTPPCVPGTPNPAGAHASGNAYDVSLKAPGITLAATPAVSTSKTGVGSAHQDKTGIAVDVKDVAAISILPVANTSSISATTNQAINSGFAAVGTVNLFNGMIVSNLVRASTEAIARPDGAAFSSAGSTFQDLIINGVPYDDVKPNTRVDLPSLGTGAYVVLYERIGSTTGPAPGQLSGGTYGANLTVNMIHVVIPALGGIPASEIIVAHSRSHADFPQAKVCSAKGRSVSGHAFVASANTDDPLKVSVVVGLSSIPSDGGSATQNVAAASLPSVLAGSGAGFSSSSGTVGPAKTTATSKAGITDLSLFDGAVTATVLTTQASSTATSASRSSSPAGTQLLNITISGNPIGNDPPPNTMYEIPNLGFVVFNEQIPDGAPAGSGHTGLTVRAIHLHVDKLGGVLPGAEVIVAESHSDATFK